MKTDASTADAEDLTSTSPATEPNESEVATASADPVTASEVGHPLGVGVGALGAGAAGAAIGAIAGPVGMLVGAVIGAVAGGIAGEEVAKAGEQATTDNPDASYTLPDLVEPTSFATHSASFESAGSGTLFAGADEGGRPAADLTPHVAETHAASAVDAASVPAHPESAGAAASPEDLIRTTAYFRFIEREAASQAGDALSDWVQAEREIQGA